MKIFFTILFVTIGFVGSAQINVIPFIGINTTKIKLGTLPPSYESGGTFALGGVELELRKKPKQHRAVFGTLVTGLNYLNNGFYYSSTFSYAAVSLYDQWTTNIQSEYWQVPLVLRINAQPFPLVEDLHFYLGAGITTNFLIKSHISEEYTETFISVDPLAPPVTTHYEDSRDVSDTEPRPSYFQRYELGAHYKRLQVSWRISISITDLYYQGLDTDWGVPANKSTYIKAYQGSGKLKQKYSELTFGFRIFK